MIQLARTLFVLLLAALVTGCSMTSSTKSRSEIIDEAEGSGVVVNTIEEDLALYHDIRDANRKRLLALIKSRASGRIRDSNYRIGPSDEIEINVFDVPELNVTARVRQSGFVSLPLIGAVEAQGKTESELVDEISTRLKTYVRQPQVSVFLSHYGSQKVAVMGAVKSPGSYSLKKGANSILEVLGEAGGVDKTSANYINFVPSELSGLSAGNEVEARARLALAAEKDVSVNESGIEIYMDQIFGRKGGIPLAVPVRGGDIIIVPEAGSVTVEGEVEKRGTYQLGQQSTLLGALAAAGGITYSALVNEVEVVRNIGEDKVHLVVDLERVARGEQENFPLRDGDIVRVPSHGGRKLTKDTFDGLSRIINFGVGGSFNVGP